MVKFTVASLRMCACLRSNVNIGIRFIMNLCGPKRIIYRVMCVCESMCIGLYVTESTTLQTQQITIFHRVFVPLHMCTHIQVSVQLLRPKELSTSRLGCIHKACLYESGILWFFVKDIHKCAHLLYLVRYCSCFYFSY